MTDSASCELQISGSLVKDASLISLPNNHGTALPAIRLEIQTRAEHPHVIVDWLRPFRDKAEDEVIHFKRGMQVCIQAPLKAHALHIHGATNVEIVVVDTTQRSLL